MQEEKKPLDSDLEEQPELLVCPSCLQENDEYGDYCCKCGAPISPTVNFDPFKRIASQGWLYRTAASDSRRKITVIGIWLIFLPSIITTLTYAFRIDPKEKKGFILIAGLLIVHYTGSNYYSDYTKLSPQSSADAGGRRRNLGDLSKRSISMIVSILENKKLYRALVRCGIMIFKFNSRSSA